MDTTIITDHYRLFFPETMPQHYEFDTDTPEYFVPLGGELPVRGVRGKEGDAVVQYLDDDAVFFGYFQTHCKKHYKMILEYFEDGCLLVYCVQGTLHWEVGFQNAPLIIDKNRQTGFSAWKGLNRLHFHPGFYRFFFVGIKNEFARLASYEFYMTGIMRDYMTMPNATGRCLPISRFTAASKSMLEQLLAANQRHLAASLNLRSQVYNLLADCEEQVKAFFKQGGITPYERIRIQADRYIQEHFMDPELSPDRVADQVNVSRSLLYKAFADNSDKVFDLIQKHRMGYAKKLLLTTPLPVADVAAMAGYFNVPSFNRIFKATFSMSPNAMRHQKKRKKLLRQNK